MVLVFVIFCIAISLTTESEEKNLTFTFGCNQPEQLFLTQADAQRWGRSDVFKTGRLLGEQNNALTAWQRAFEPRGVVFDTEHYLKLKSVYLHRKTGRAEYVVLLGKGGKEHNMIVRNPAWSQTDTVITTNVIVGLTQAVANKINVVNALRDVWRKPGCNAGVKSSPVSANAANGLGGDTPLMPTTFVIRQLADCKEFVNNVVTSEHAQKLTWIVKLPSVHKGKGLSIHTGTSFYTAQPWQCDSDVQTLTKIEQMTDATKRSASHKPDVIVQQYLKPMLVNGTKFDIRWYILVASSTPWVVFYHPGFIRRSTVPYIDPQAAHELSDSITGDDLVMHLTNIHTQKDAQSSDAKKRKHEPKEFLLTLQELATALVQQEANEKGSGGGFTATEDFLDQFTAHAMQTAQLLFTSALPKLKRVPGTYQVLGVDTMMDEKGNFYLIEANNNPGMRLEFNKWMPKLSQGMANEAIELVLGLQLGTFDIRKVPWAGTAPDVKKDTELGNWALVWYEGWNKTFFEPAKMNHPPMHQPPPCPLCPPPQAQCTPLAELQHSLDC